MNSGIGGRMPRSSGVSYPWFLARPVRGVGLGEEATRTRAPAGGGLVWHAEKELVVCFQILAVRCFNLDCHGQDVFFPLPHMESLIHWFELVLHEAGSPGALRRSELLKYLAG